MSFLFASTFESFDKEMFSHHPQGSVVCEEQSGLAVYIQTREPKDNIAKQENCLVAVLGSIEQCTPQQLLSRYLKEGIDVSKSLFGAFIALIVHGNRIFVIRDPMGLQTVYYREEAEGRLTLSSDPVACSQSGISENKLLQQMFFHGGHILYGTAHWRGMTQLSPGSWMSRYEHHRVQQIPYYQLPNKREKDVGLQRLLYTKTLQRILRDTAQVQYFVPLKNIQTLVILAQLKKQNRVVTLYGLESDTWVQELGDYFSMPVQLVEQTETMWDTLRSMRWYTGAPVPYPDVLRLYSLSSYLQEKDVYLPIEESFGGAWLKRFLLLLHYFSPNRGEAYIRACMGAGEWSQLPKMKRSRVQLTKNLNALLSFEGQHTIDAVLRIRVKQWGGMVLLPILRASFPHAFFPLFDERLVRIALSMPRTHVVHKGIVQHWYRSSLLKGIDKKIVDLCTESMSFVLDDECRLLAHKKRIEAPIHEDLKQALSHHDYSEMDRILWYILQYS